MLKNSLSSFVWFSHAFIQKFHTLILNPYKNNTFAFSLAQLTYENIEYPRHFHFPENAMPVSDEEIHKAVKNIVKNIGENYFYIGLETGDSLVFGINWEDGIEIFVCKNPASTMLFKEVEADF